MPQSQLFKSSTLFLSGVSQHGRSEWINKLSWDVGIMTICAHHGKSLPVSFQRIFTTCEGGTGYLGYFYSHIGYFFLGVPLIIFLFLAPTGRKWWADTIIFLAAAVTNKSERGRGKKGEVSERGRRFVMPFAGG